jgi:CelD/BcsL family acetyltransferase involved in cellulose biosynthesis
MPIQAKIAPSWRDLSERLDPDAAGQPTPFQPTPFQAGAWLRAWYDTLAKREDVTPLLIELVDSASGRTLAGLPLIKRRDGELTCIEFADLDITDYNLPILARGGSLDRLPPDQVVACLSESLPRADILRFNKMPVEIEGNSNSFAFHRQATPSLLHRNILTIDGTWEDYRRKRLAKKVRKELERSWRVFERDACDARFDEITDVDEALALLPVIEALHQRRVATRNGTYLLDDEPYAAFYRALIGEGLASGDVTLTVLRDGPDKLVAALLALRAGNTLTMVRMAQDCENWPQCSPGRLVIDQTIQAFFKEGLRHFDFTTGNYAYKDAFGVSHYPLFELKLPLSVRGRLHLGRAEVVESLKTRIRRHPRFYESLKSWVGKRDAGRT